MFLITLFTCVNSFITFQYYYLSTTTTEEFIYYLDHGKNITFTMSCNNDIKFDVYKYYTHVVDSSENYVSYSFHNQYDVNYKFTLQFYALHTGTNCQLYVNEFNELIHIIDKKIDSVEDDMYNQYIYLYDEINDVGVIVDELSHDISNVRMEDRAKFAGITVYSVLFITLLLISMCVICCCNIYMLCKKHDPSKYKKIDGETMLNE